MLYNVLVDEAFNSAVTSDAREPFPADFPGAGTTVDFRETSAPKTHCVFLRKYAGS